MQNYKEKEATDYEEEDNVNVKTVPIDAEEYLKNTKYRVVYQTTNYLLPQIYDLIAGGYVINIRPDYQRRLRWDNKQKSLLIESLLLNLPIPSIYLYESEFSIYEVMDGQQRLAALREFMDNKLELTGMEMLTSLNGKKFDDLSPLVISVFNRASVTAIVVLMESEFKLPPSEKYINNELKRTIFNRLNTGGKSLNAQEIRNALNPGKFNDLLFRLSEFDKFTEVFGIPPHTEGEVSSERQENKWYADMRDCEFILRFFALSDEENLKGPLKTMLDNKMKVRIEEAEFESESRRFKSRFRFLYHLFDSEPFIVDGKIALALYDGLMVAIDKLWDQKDTIMNDKARIKKQLQEILSNEEERIKIIGGKGSATSIKDRIKILMNLLLQEQKHES